MNTQIYFNNESIISHRDNKRRQKAIKKYIKQLHDCHYGEYSSIDEKEEENDNARRKTGVL